MKNHKPRLTQINLIITLVLSVLWITVLVANGMAQVISWTMLLMIIPLIGFSYLLITLLIISRTLFKQRELRKDALFSILLGIAKLTPLGITLGLTDIVYPASHDTSSALIMSSPFKEDVIVG